MSDGELQIPDKAHFKIGEVCRLTDTQPYVLRFWESEFPSLAPQKTRSGQRIYRREDILMVLRIKQLLYEESYSIAGARKQLESADSGPEYQRQARPQAQASGGNGAAAAGGPDEARLEQAREELRGALELLK